MTIYFVPDPIRPRGGQDGLGRRISKSYYFYKGGESFGGTEHNLTLRLLTIFFKYFTSNSNYGVGYIFCPDSLGGSCVWKVPEGYDYVSAQAQVNIAPILRKILYTSQYSDFRKIYLSLSWNNNFFGQNQELIILTM